MVDKTREEVSNALNNLISLLSRGGSSYEILKEDVQKIKGNFEKANGWSLESVEVRLGQRVKEFEGRMYNSQQKIAAPVYDTIQDCLSLARKANASVVKTEAKEELDLTVKYKTANKQVADQFKPKEGKAIEPDVKPGPQRG